MVRANILQYMQSVLCVEKGSFAHCTYQASYGGTRYRNRGAGWIEAWRKLVESERISANGRSETATFTQIDSIPERSTNKILGRQGKLLYQQLQNCSRLLSQRPLRGSVMSERMWAHPWHQNSWRQLAEAIDLHRDVGNTHPAIAWSCVGLKSLVGFSTFRFLMSTLSTHIVMLHGHYCSRVESWSI